MTTTIFQEIRHAFRMFARSPGFTAVAALSLAVGIGANSAMFSVVDAELLRPLPVRDPGAVVAVSAVGSTDNGSGLSYPNYRHLREQSQSFDGLVAYRRSTLVTFGRSRGDVREMRMGMLVSDNFFDTLGVQPAFGRMFTPQEGSVPGRDAVVVLGHDFWKNVLAGDTAIVNSVVWINGIDFTVVGVAQPSFTGMDESIPAFFLPVMMAERLGVSPEQGGGAIPEQRRGARENLLEDRASSTFAVKGRLKSGVSRQQAQTELATIWRRLEQQYPEINRGRVMSVRSQLEERIREEGPATTAVLAMVMALVAVVLIIACANVASLMLGRGRARSREMAVRLALGVSRGRLLRQLLVESFVLALIGCALGIGFAYGGLELLKTIPVPSDLRPVVIPRLDYRVLIVSLLAAGVSAVLFGIVPAWQSVKTQLVPALKSAEPGQTGRQRTLGRNLLVVGQIALSMVLLVATGVLFDGFRRVLVLDPGFRTDHLMTMSLDTSAARYTPAQTNDFYRSLVERARALPDVSSVALTSWVLLDRGGGVHSVIPEGYQLPRGRAAERIFSAVVDEHYFDTMKAGLMRGRAFTADDRDDSRGVAIVNEEFAKTYWPNQEPIGKRLRLNNGEGPWLEVVGLTTTGKYLFVAEPPRPFLYLPFAQHQRTAMSLIVETTNADATPLAAPLRDVVRGLDVNQPVMNVRTFSSLYEQRAIRVPRRILEIVGTMGLIGLTLTLIGLYGLVAYSVARRTREIGLRMAVGANRSDVLKMVLRQGLMLSTAGLLVGGVASVAVARLLAAGMVGLGAVASPATYVVVPVTLIALTMAACYIPARRAATIDPLRALRYE
jgi:predicted permease